MTKMSFCLRQALYIDEHPIFSNLVMGQAINSRIFMTVYEKGVYFYEWSDKGNPYWTR